MVAVMTDLTQLKAGARMVIPVGLLGAQQLVVVE
jgi:hypothetical protein